MKNTDKPSSKRRKSLRLAHYDYSSEGWYFVTICTKDKKRWFGKCEEGEMRLNEVGRIAKECIQNIPNHYPHTSKDEYVVMPNHVHAIIVINQHPSVGAENFLPLQHSFGKPIPKSLSSIVRGFKIGVTKWCRNNNHGYFFWQRNYYERVIRDDHELEKIRNYIYLNPNSPS